MKCLFDFTNPGRLFRRQLFFTNFIILILSFTSCTSHTEPYFILEFTGKGEVYNYSKSLYPIFYEADSINSTALLASSGDIIVYGENSCFIYKEPSQKKISIKTINSIGFINDKFYSINIPGNDEMIPWFKQMNSTDISSLGFLYFNSPIIDSYIPYMTILAETKPDIGLGYDGNLKELDRLFEIFNPKFMVGVNISQKDFNLLSGLSNLEFLSASLNDSIYTIPFPAMPKLKHLILANIQKNDIKSNDFLINNKQIEKLTILGSDNFDLVLLEPLNNLKELIINGTDTVENFSLLNHHKEIELLSVTGEKLNNDLILSELPDIRWLSFYEDATQDGFSSLIESHPGLEVVEIINNDKINNLQPLLSLKKLQGITVTDTITDFNTVKSLKNLKYLSIPDNVFNDSIVKAELLKALPDTKIVANQGVCLGSGWLLLIIPFILILRVFTQQKSPKFQY